MDPIIEEKRKKRFKFMDAAYKEAEGSSTAPLSVFQIGEKLGFETGESLNIAQYLYGEGLLRSMGNGVAVLTHKGVVEVESAMSAPDKPTEHFPPVNLIYVHNMSQSQIQQGTIGSTQTGTFTANDLEKIREFVQAYKERLPELQLQRLDHQDAEAQIATVEAQLRSSKPDFSILKTSSDLLTGFLANAAGSAAAMYLQAHFPTIFR